MSRITISSTNILTTFSQASTRANLTSGENLPISLGKISKFIATTPGLIVDAGTTYTHSGTTYTVGTGCEIFNNSSNEAAGNYSHAEGFSTQALGSYSHAEGFNNIASGGQSHAEGHGTTASGADSHAEGWNTTASGVGSHAEGWNTTASGDNSHAGGKGTIAASDNQTAIGQYNVSDPNDKYAFIIGNGVYDAEEHTTYVSNAIAIDWNGLIYVGNSATGADVAKMSAGLIDLVDNGTKNILNFVGYQASGNTGLTVTRNSDGSLTFSGTTSSTATYFLNFTFSKSQQYVISGVPANSNITLRLRTQTDTDVAVDFGSGATFTPTVGTTYKIVIRLASGKTYTDVTVYPMICTKAEWDVSQNYVQYRPIDIDDTPTSGSGNPVSSGGVYTALSTKITADDALSTIYGGGTRIPSGADIDSATYRVPGVYYVNSGGTGGDAPTINGIPYTGAGGRLIVTSTGSASYIFQDYYPRTVGANRNYRRFYNNGTWTDWFDFRSLTSFYDNAVSLEPPEGTTISLNSVGLGRFRVSTTGFSSRIDNGPDDLKGKMYLLESGVTAGKGSNYYYQMIHPAGTADIIYKRVAISNTWGDWETFRSDKYLKSLIDESDKNLVNPLNARGYSTQWSYYPITKGGITFTLNDNGSITTSGTAAATLFLRIPVTLETGRTYAIAGCPANGSTDTYCVQARLAGTNTAVVTDYGNGAIFVTEQTDYDIGIRYPTGAAANETFTVMVCPVEKWDISHTVVPYKQNTVEITKALVDLIDGGPKNIIDNRITSSTKNGVTATTNADGSITISGKDSRTSPTSDFVLVTDMYNPSAANSFTSNIKADKTKTYICPSTGNSNVRLQALGYNSSTDYAVLSSSDANVTFTPVKNYIVFRIFIKQNADFTNNEFTLYPMVCERTAWDISKKFVKYRPSYQEMYERIVALENA